MKKSPGKTSQPTPPAHLSSAGKAWWVSVMAEYALDDPAAQAILSVAAEARDRADQARKEIAAAGMTKVDRFGQIKPHPSVAIERDAWGVLLRALASLNLDLEPLRDGPGRPPGGHF